MEVDDLKRRFQSARNLGDVDKLHLDLGAKIESLLDENKLLRDEREKLKSEMSHELEAHIKNDRIWISDGDSAYWAIPVDRVPMLAKLFSEPICKTCNGSQEIYIDKLGTLDIIQCPDCVETK